MYLLMIDYQPGRVAIWREIKTETVLNEVFLEKEKRFLWTIALDLDIRNWKRDDTYSSLNGFCADICNATKINNVSASCE